MTGVFPLVLSKGGNRGGGAFQNRITGNFVVQDRLETNLLQLFEHPENSEWFSVISAVI